MGQRWRERNLKSGVLEEPSLFLLSLLPRNVLQLREVKVFKVDRLQIIVVAKKNIYVLMIMKQKETPNSASKLQIFVIINDLEMYHKLFCGLLG